MFRCISKDRRATIADAAKYGCRLVDKGAYVNIKRGLEPSWSRRKGYGKLMPDAAERHRNGHKSTVRQSVCSRARNCLARSGELDS